MNWNEIIAAAIVSALIFVFLYCSTVAVIAHRNNIQCEGLASTNYVVAATNSAPKIGDVIFFDGTVERVVQETDSKYYRRQWSLAHPDGHFEWSLWIERYPTARDAQNAILRSKEYRENRNKLSSVTVHTVKE